MEQRGLSSKRNRMAEEVKLFGAWGSPFSRRVELALRLKGVPYEYVEEDLANKSPLLLKYNPIHKKVPVLLHHGKPIVESLVILDYIEEAWEENPLLPKDPYERAMARFWTRFMDEKCFGALWMSCWSEGDMQQNFLKQSREYLSLLENELKPGKKFFGGDAIGLVDIAANFIAFWIPVLQETSGISLIDDEKHPILCKWTKEFLSSDAVKECLPPREKLLAFFQSRKEAILATKAPVY